jgi:RNA polymerase sigma-70 factor (ECF subfamily)
MNGTEIEACRTRLTAFALRLCDNADEAEDIAQEAIIKGWRASAQFEGRNTLYKWLCTIARRVWIDRAKAARSSMFVSLDEPCVEGSGLDYLDVLSSDCDEFRPVVEEHVLVRKALRGLGPVHGRVAGLRYLDQMALDEIATELSIPLGTVKSRLNTARVRMRERFPHLV